MRSTTATILLILLLAVVFIVLNLEPATISFFGLASLTQPVGVIVSIAFVGGALIVLLLKAGVDLRLRWLNRGARKVSKASAASLKDYQVGLEALARGNLDDARVALRRVVDHDPDHVGALFALGNLDREAGDVEGAIKRHITANARKPATAEIVKALAEDYALAGRTEECIRALDDLLALSQDKQYALAKKREVYEAAGKFEEAIEAHRALIKTGAPDDGRLTALRLKAAEAAPTAAQARSHLDAAVHSNKRCVAAYKLLGESHWKEDNTSEAAKAWRKGWKATGDLSLLRRLCDLYLFTGQSKKALKLCRDAQASNPGEPLPALLHAVTALQLEDAREASSALASPALAENPIASLLHIELSRRIGNEESLHSRIQEAFSSLPWPTHPFECRSCREPLEGWSAQCPGCEAWDTIKLVALGQAELPVEEEPAAANQPDSEEQPS